ncbi:hypothetical protein [Photobacterium indicum]|uniref:hypothetical protein n=1 Tax=Photobacterium indicum TaxID=81447 RepID=UPI003D10689E
MSKLFSSIAEPVNDELSYRDKYVVRGYPAADIEHLAKTVQTHIRAAIELVNIDQALAYDLAQDAFNEVYELPLLHESGALSVMALHNLSLVGEFMNIMRSFDRFNERTGERWDSMPKTTEVLGESSENLEIRLTEFFADFDSMKNKIIGFTEKLYSGDFLLSNEEQYSLNPLAA